MSSRTLSPSIPSHTIPYRISGGKANHVKPLPHKLHWLPVKQRVVYKMAVITYHIQFFHTSISQLTHQAVRLCKDVAFVSIITADRKPYTRNSMVPFSTHSMTPNLGSGPHFRNSGAFPRIAMTLVCCQWHNRRVWSTESDRSKLLTLIAAVYLPHCCVRLILSYCYDFLLLC